MIRRKDTLGFVDFMRGKYSIYNKEYILNMIKQMTNDEKSRLITDPFVKLWNDLWGGSTYKSAAVEAAATPNDNTFGPANRQLNYKDPYKAEEQNSRNKFESLRSGVYTKTNSYNLEELVQMTEQNWTEPEWGFPKGRRNYQEKDYDCAVREFCEETGYSPDNLIPLKNIQPFEEIFTGSNYKSYKHKYYVTYMKYEDTLSSRRLQVCEVSESSWMAIEECNAAIRPYNVEKKRLLVAVDKMLSSNHLSQINC
jgi:8-oxo-dGTP pyrophosphatase MutT (NUDIX family)